MTLAELASRTHYSRASWERWFNGKRLINRAALASLATVAGADGGRLSALLERAEAAARTAAQPGNDSGRGDGEVYGADGSGRRADSVGPSGADRILRYQLPVDTRVFTGRLAELDVLAELADRAAGADEASAAVVAAIDGMPGIGKSALAVRAAHRVRDRFPDGQLFLDLRGQDGCAGPLTALDALDRLLRSLGVPAELIPADLAARAACYRHRLAGSRVLVVLDNAANTAQIRPLLPDAPGSLVLITSRRHLAGLDDAAWLTVDVLSEAESVELFHRVAGRGRVPASHPAVPQLVALCGRVPLAIRIVAARLRMRRALSVETLLEELRGQANALDGLQDEDRSVASVLEPSYAALPGPEQSLLRRLAHSCAIDVDVFAAANLAGVDIPAAEDLLESLLDHNAVLQRTPGRYRVHDLVRAYVCSMPAVDSVRDLRRSADRLLDYYVAAASVAGRRLTTRIRPRRTHSEPAFRRVPPLGDSASAGAWMRAEQENILSAIARAERDGDPCRAAELSQAMAGFLHQEKRWQEAVALLEQAAESAVATGDRLGAADTLAELGRLQRFIGNHRAAAESLDRALALYRSLNTSVEEAKALA